MATSSTLAEDCPREMAAATLLGVRERVLASSPPSSSTRNPNRGWLDSEAVAVPSESSASHDVSAATPFTATTATTASYIQHQHNTTSADSIAITTFPPPAVSSSSRNKKKEASSTMHQSQSHQQSQQFLSMSSLGLGVDTCVQEDATLACQRALQDAMNRNLLRLSGNGNGRQELLVLLGVPRGLHVHQGQIQGDLPRDTKATIRIQEGGLWIQNDKNDPAICSVVACLTLQQQASSTSPEEEEEEHLEEPPQRNGATTTKPHGTNGQSQETSRTNRHHHHPTSEEDEDGNDSTLDQYYDPVSSPEHRAQAHPPLETSTLSATTITSPTSSHKLSAALSRTHSMEVLAMISERLVNDAAAAATASKAAPAIRGGLATAALEESRTNLVAVATEIRPLIVPRGAPAPSSASITSDEDAAARQQQLQQAYNYQKLPPGLTMKNNRRLFVQHAYQDYCQETPLAEELSMLKSTKTPNAAFPLKLHEILTEIEHNGQAHIIGWLPHGRSFRIHKPQEFCDFILPRYFVMTKKSSFLRQLNLYGFNRFSAGPDQGSYYHEKFLRGMKFLTRRMTRQKVNGNRIRSAGNPEEEPHLANYPECPPPAY